jgi:hypothetical protein
MKVFVTALVLVLAAVWAPPSGASNGSKVKAAPGRVESRAKKIGGGERVKQTTKGGGKTAVGGVKHSGDKLKEAAPAAPPQAKSTWESVKDGTWSFGLSVKDGVWSFGRSVKNFFGGLFSN